MKAFLLIAAAVLCFAVFVISEEAASTAPVDPTFALPELDGVQKEGHHYQAEINKLMNIIVKSLYSNRDIFVRELVSNAADACDKIRYLSLTDSSVLGANTNLEIKIRVDKENKLIHFRDTGIGMTRADLVSNLGSIAKSGTSEFLQKAANQGNLQVIGQFGVGFYSSFLVADKVTVTSKNNEDDQYIWESTIDDSASYSVTKDPRGNTLGRGTLITLHLKDDAFEYLDVDKIQKIIDKYNEFIQFPIYLMKSREVEVAAPEKEEKTAEEGVEVKEEDETETKPAPKKETVWEWVKANTAAPLWRRAKADITEQEYIDFYKNVLRDYSEPMDYIHFKTEGDVEFTGLIYIPKQPPGDMMRLDYNTNLKLYVKRVFITDDFKDLIPSYLNFLKGVIDSDDLELNVSREMLQHSKTLEAIKKKLLRKIIALFQDMATERPEKFEEFYNKYSTSLKLGVIQDTQNRDRLSKILRFSSAKNVDGKKISFEDYVSGMKKGQETIYYLGGENIDVLRRSPLIERLLKRGYDVLLLSEPIDEYAISALDRYDRKYKFTDVSKDGLNLKDDEDLQKKLDEQFKPLTEYMQTVLSDKISKVAVSVRLAKTPAAIVAAEYGYSPNMERVMKAQALRDERYFRGDQKHVMEINARHPLVKKLLAVVEADSQSDETANNVRTLHDIAVLNSGFNLKDTSLLSDRVNRMMAIALNIDPNEPVEEEVIVEEEAAEPKVEAKTEKVQEEL
jgi:heat shock protein beta